jgi:hypothetical protein
MADGSIPQILGLLRTYHSRLAKWCQNGFFNFGIFYNKTVNVNDKCLDGVFDSSVSIT